MNIMHLALYRKYRPENFVDVVGQEQIVNLLVGAINQRKISHAYLFCGGRGTGKTTVARIFAKDIGCNPEDVIEIDAASNRGIDEIRELRDAVRTAPFSSPYKVYIIDEAHMLTKEAANALLKTLEEPPTHVIFILATTDPEKLPQTIVSRCQKLVFKQPDLKTLAARLQYVGKEEGKVIKEEEAILIAKHGKGSYRDALGVLEQILTLSGKEVQSKDIMMHLGVSEKETLFALIEALCVKDVQGVVKTIETLRSSHGDAMRSYDECLEIIRQGLLVRVGGQSDDQELSRIAKEYPHTIASKSILTLLEKRHLLEVSSSHSWTAFEAIYISMLDQ